MESIIERAEQADSSAATSITLPVGIKTALVVPTLNAGSDFTYWLDALRTQTYIPNQLLLVDSSSTDHTVDYARAAGFSVKIIERDEFSHGGTRQMCVESLPEADVIVFLTQDATLASPDALKQLLAAFSDPRVGAAYGRQLPRPGAHAIEAHARLFNYTGHREVKTLDDIPRLGMKTVFISNSFAAYRRTALEECSGFPRHVISTEDTYCAARMVLKDWKVAYCPEATVYHSHGFSFRQEFRRYFDIGVFYSREGWIHDKFGRAEGEGFRFVRSEMRYLWKHRKRAIGSAVVRTALKLAGYKLGSYEQRLPRNLRRFLSCNRTFWDQQVGVGRSGNREFELNRKGAVSAQAAGERN